MTPAMNSTRLLSARAVALIGTGAVVAYALLAAVQILVWNPQAAVPGVGLDQIYADVAATGESMAAGMVIAFLAVGPLLAIALLWLGARQLRDAPRPPWLALAPPGIWVLAVWPALALGGFAGVILLYSGLALVLVLGAARECQESYSRGGSTFRQRCDRRVQQLGT